MPLSLCLMAHAASISVVGKMPETPPPPFPGGSIRASLREERMPLATLEERLLHISPSSLQGMTANGVYMGLRISFSSICLLLFYLYPEALPCSTRRYPFTLEVDF